MALLQKFFGVRSALSILRVSSVFKSTAANRFSTNPEKEDNVDENMPVEMANPYVQEKPQCILCKYDIEPHYKNVRLLSQFVSRYTGRIYGRHITGLCEHKHNRVKQEINKARRCALMGTYTKEPNYLTDPRLYNELNPLRPHKYI